jgi:hypothetical protein
VIFYIWIELIQKSAAMGDALRAVKQTGQHTSRIPKNRVRLF